MDWKIVYLILSIAALVFGIWNLAQKKTFIMAIMSILWFGITLFVFFIPDWYNLEILSGLSLGNLCTYIGIPSLLLIGFLTSRFSK